MSRRIAHGCRCLRRKKDIMTLALVQGINDLHQLVIVTDAWHGKQPAAAARPG